MICDNGGTQPSDNFTPTRTHAHTRSPMKADNVSLADKHTSPVEI